MRRLLIQLLVICTIIRACIDSSHSFVQKPILTRRSAFGFETDKGFRPAFSGTTHIEAGCQSTAEWNEPLLAIVTEPNSCDDRERLESTIKAVSKAVSTDLVSLVSVRIALPSDDQRTVRYELVNELLQRLWDLSKTFHFRLVVSSDWIDAADIKSVHGVHVKESHRARIRHFRARFGQSHHHRSPLVGMSCHSLDFALDTFEHFDPDYLFVGTCYQTESHPEKSANDVEGPELPGRIGRELDRLYGREKRPKIFAIGGIDESNCHEPVGQYGADGVAVIRAVLRADEPAEAVKSLVASMRSTRSCEQ